MHRFERAIVRTPGPDFAAGLTTVTWSEPPAYTELLEQHAAYVAALREAGVTVEVLPALQGLPDAYFVEDVAVVVPQLAVLTSPGAAARRGEVELIAAALSAWRPLARIEAAARLDGGDVLIADPRVFVGLSSRTNAAGVEALAALLRPHGYEIDAVPVAAGLHLKSSVNLIGPNTLVVSAEFAARELFAGFEIVELDPADGYAANAVWINDRLLIAAGFPRVRDRLRAQLGSHVEIVELDMRAAQAMDGGLSCLSLRG